MGLLTSPDLHKRSLANFIGRLFQLVGAITVCVLYGRILHKALENDVYGDPKWIFAVTVGAISGGTAVVYMVLGLFFEFRAFAVLFAWDTVNVILWIVCSGIFGKMYLTEKPEMDQGIAEMKTAAGFDLANMLLWMASASYGGYVLFVSKRDLLLEGRQKFTSKGEESGEKARSTR